MQKETTATLSRQKHRWPDVETWSWWDRRSEALSHRHAHLRDAFRAHSCGFSLPIALKQKSTFSGSQLISFQTCGPRASWQWRYARTLLKKKKNGHVSQAGPPRTSRLWPSWQGDSWGSGEWVLLPLMRSQQGGRWWVQPLGTGVRGRGRRQPALRETEMRSFREFSYTRQEQTSLCLRIHLFINGGLKLL